MRTFIGPDIILSDLTEGPTLFAQSGSVCEVVVVPYVVSAVVAVTVMHVHW